MTDTRLDRMDTARALLAIVERLRGAYGPPAPNTTRPLVDELIVTILSQHTSDANTERAFAQLKSRFPRWEDAAEADVSDIADAIRTGGLANVKSRTIQSVLRCIVDRTGAIDLDVLRDMPTEEARRWLTSLVGVGPKTAACVLLFSLARPVMPVDTHVHRVSLRMGLIPPGTSAEHAHRLLDACGTWESMYDAHMLLIQHGRRTCSARLPKCESCVLADVCPSRNDVGMLSGDA